MSDTTPVQTDTRTWQDKSAPLSDAARQAPATGNQQATDMLRGAIAETQQSAPQATQEARSATEPNDADAWADSLDDAGKTALNAYVALETTRLKTALDTERAQRKELAKQLKELSVKPADDTAWKAKIEAISGQLSEANLKASFYESAAGQDDLAAKRYGAAYKIAKIDGLIDEDGAVDWAALKEQHDYLFSTPVVATPAKGHAGNGVGGRAQKPQNINDVLRGAR